MRCSHKGRARFKRLRYRAVANRIPKVAIRIRTEGGRLWQRGGRGAMGGTVTGGIVTGGFAMRASALGTSALGAVFRHGHVRSRGGPPPFARLLSGRSSGMGTSAMGRLSAIRVGMVLFARDSAAALRKHAIRASAVDPRRVARRSTVRTGFVGFVERAQLAIAGLRPGPARICTIPERTAENRPSLDLGLDRVAGSVDGRPGRSKPLQQRRGRHSEQPGPRPHHRAKGQPREPVGTRTRRCSLAAIVIVALLETDSFTDRRPSLATAAGGPLISFRGPQRAFGRGVAQLGSAHRSGR